MIKAHLSFTPRPTDPNRFTAVDQFGNTVGIISIVPDEIANHTTLTLRLHDDCAIYRTNDYLVRSPLDTVAGFMLDAALREAGLEIQD